MNNKLKYAVTLLIILQIFNLFKINGLNNELESLNINQGHSTEFIRDELSNIYNNLDNIIKQDLSLIQDAEVEIGELDKENLKVDLLYKLTPKEVRDNTKLFLVFGEESIEMDRLGNSFSKSVKQNIFNEDIYPEISIREDDLIKTTDDNRIIIDSLKQKIFPNINIMLLGSSSSADGYYTREGTLEFMNDREYTEISLNNPKFIATLDDKIIKEEKISLQELHDGFIINEKFQVESKEVLILKISFVDDLGLNHDFVIDKFVGSNKDYHPEPFVTELIYSKDKELLWEGEVY